MWRAVADAAQHIIKPVVIGFGKVMQHIVGHQLLAARMAHTKAYARIVRPDVLMDRAQTVMARMPAAHLVFDLAGGEVDLVMQNHDILRVQLVKAHGGLHRLTREVHKGFRCEQDRAGRSEPPFADAALMFALPRGKPVIGRDAVERHKADVVPVARIFAARIAKANDQFHGICSCCVAAQHSKGAFGTELVKIGAFRRW